ncbi:MAG: epoxyqueuosine reductase QueH [Eubacterium sp.]|nr:epoxyqueuosine reductase QueH [Eubacterium sp.]
MNVEHNEIIRNYQRELEYIIENMTERSRLLLHCCCAPCSSYVTEYLHKYFDITVFFYNPNITGEKEYIKRKEELKRYLREAPYGNGIVFLDGDYEPERFADISRGLENEPERGRRCTECYRLRLEKTARVARDGGYDYFCTTLSISPHKDAERLMRIGEELAGICGVRYLPSDFKKRNGYKRSIELSKEYGLYRQDYCGCEFSIKNKKNE